MEDRTAEDGGQKMEDRRLHGDRVGVGDLG